MILITDKREKIATKEMKVAFIPIGTVFSGYIYEKSYSGLFMKIYNCIFDLQRPNQTWCDHGVIVHNYQPVTAELIIN